MPNLGDFALDQDETMRIGGKWWQVSCSPRGYVSACEVGGAGPYVDIEEYIPQEIKEKSSTDAYDVEEWRQAMRLARDKAIARARELAKQRK